MSTRRIRWLYGELGDLVRTGVLDGATAQRIEDHYGPVTETPVRRLLVPVFGVLGALLIGAGVMLLVGHNWDQLDRPLRAALTFSLLLAAQAIAGWTLWRRRQSVAWYEGSGLFLGLTLGTTIALIAQTYQISGDLESFMMTWALLALPIPYLLRSRVGAGLYWVLATIWLTAQGWHEPVAVQAGVYLLLVALIVPFVAVLIRRCRDEARTVLVLWTAVICLVIAGLTVLPRLSYNLWFPVAAGFFGALFAAGPGRHAPGGDERTAFWRRPLQVVGASGLAVMLFVGSFADPWRDMLEVRNSTHGLGVTLAASGIALALLTFSSLRGCTLWRTAKTHRALLAMTPLLLTAVWALSFRPGNEGWLMLAANAIGLGVGVATVRAGLRSGNLGTANGGLLLIVALVVARFFDNDWSFVVRGIGFIVMGAVFLAMNLRLLKGRQEVQS